MHLQYGENSYLFVYRFGCLVFFNMSNEEVTRETDKLRNAIGGALVHPTTETYQVNLGDFPTRVEFDYVELKKLSVDHLRLIAVTLGQSAALEYFEIKTERLLNDTSSILQDLASRGRITVSQKNLVRIIGSTASARQNIISNLAILDPPEATWKSKELEKFFRELQQNFDIDLRFRALDRKLTLIQDNIEILVDLATGRQANFLEGLIVLLIVFEIIAAFLFK